MSSPESPATAPFGAGSEEATYRNPIVAADRPDPDVVRVGADYWMATSSFHFLPGLPIYHSRDLVEWTLVSHAVRRLPSPTYDRPAFGRGVWAPALRFREGRFLAYFATPDEGIFRVETDDPRGRWSEPLLVKPARGWIDPCPFWDDDGSAWLVSAFAKSRAGFRDRIHLSRMDDGGLRTVDEGRTLYDGTGVNPVIEGPKLYKYKGMYYVLAPAGGISGGWQVALRARSLGGPWEARRVMAQGGAGTNGPHQGAWVETAEGQHWFLHFQDAGPSGRILHLQPLAWREGWPVIGIDREGRGCGEPVDRYARPRTATGRPPDPSAPMVEGPDRWCEGLPGRQWQWQANPVEGALAPLRVDGRLRLASLPFPGLMPAAGRPFSAGALPTALLEAFPAPRFSASIELDAASLVVGDVAGLVVVGDEYRYVGIERRQDGLWLIHARGAAREDESWEIVDAEAQLAGSVARLSVEVDSGRCLFGATAEGAPSRVRVFTARPANYVGARIGLFCGRPGGDLGGVASFGPLDLTQGGDT